MDLISILFGIVIGLACGIVISTISLDNIENKLNENYKKCLEKEKKI